jgi:hypothetical protein
MCTYTYTALLIVQLILGNFVVGSYIWLAFFSNISSEELEVFWAGLSPTNHRTIFCIWFGSMVLTVVSFLFSTYQIVFQSEDWFVFDVSFDQNRQYLLACYIVFLLSATAWAPLTLYSIRNGTYKMLVIISLWLTALSCVGFAVFIFNTAANTIDSTTLTIMKTGAGWVVFHHLILDAIYWAYTFYFPPTEGTALLSIDRPRFSAFVEPRRRDLSFI